MSKAADKKAWDRGVLIDAICGCNHGLSFDDMVEATRMGFMTRTTAHDGSGDPEFHWNRDALSMLNLSELLAAYTKLKQKAKSQKAKS